MIRLDFTTFEDHENIFDLLSPRHGLYRGKFFQNWIEGMIEDRTKKQFCTFRDFHNLGLAELSIITTYLNEGDIIICNYNSTPDVIVSEAVRASMSIPVMFDRFTFTKGFNTGQDFVDGGLMLNYGISLYNGYPEDETIGLFLHDVGNKQPPRIIDGNGFISFAKANFEAIMSAQNAEFFSNEKYLRQSVIIDSFGIPAVDFDLPQESKLKLYKSGVDSTCKYLDSKK